MLMFRYLLVIFIFLCFTHFLIAQSFSPSDTTLLNQQLEEADSLIEKKEYDKAIAILLDAEKIGVSLDDTIKLVRVYTSLFSTIYRQGDYKRAEDYGKRYLETTIKIYGEESEEAVKVYSNLGIVASKLTKIQEAFKFHEKAIEIKLLFFGENDLQLTPNYLNLATVYIYADDYQSAVDLLTKVLRIRKRELGAEAKELVSVYMNLGICYKHLNKYKEAEETLNLAHQLIKLHFPSNHLMVGDILTNFAAIEDDLGDYQKAIDYYEQARQIYQVNNALFQIAGTDFNLGLVWKKREKLEVAISFFLIAADEFKNLLGEKHPYVADCYENLAQCRGSNGDWKKDSVIFYFEKALSIYKEFYGNESALVGDFYGSYGYYYLEQKDYEKALDYFEKELACFERIFGRNHIRTGDALYHISRSYLQQGNYLLAINYLQKSLSSLGLSSLPVESFNEIVLPNLLLEPFQDLGLAYIKLSENQVDYQDEALYYLQEVDRLADYLRMTYDKFGGRTQLAFKMKQTYESAIIAALDKGLNNNGAFYFSEKNKNLILLEQFRNTKAERVSNVPAHVVDEERRISAGITYWERKIHNLQEEDLPESDSLIRTYKSEIFLLKQKNDSLVNRIQMEYPEYFKLKYDIQPVSVDSLQKVLPPNHTLLEYFVGDSSLFIFLVQPDRYEVQEVKNTDKLEEWVRNFRTAINTTLEKKDKPDGYEDEMAKALAHYGSMLYDKLLAPVKEHLTDTLIIIPDGVLNYLPFEALLTRPVPDSMIYNFNDYPYLLDTFFISYCYSATLLKEMQEKRHKRKPATPLVAFAPYCATSAEKDAVRTDTSGNTSTTKGSLETLLHSGSEVEEIQQKWGGHIFLGVAATKKAFQEVAEDARILHLSTHAEANNEQGEYSSLYFYFGLDSVLYVKDLYNLQVNADMVVLSACETGLGELQRGEGVISLARAFAYAGAKSVITSLWKVNDERTKQLMVGFYERLLIGDAKQSALCKAKKEYLKNAGEEGAHPYYWAGFIGIGDMCPIGK